MSGRSHTKSDRGDRKKGKPPVTSTTPGPSQSATRNTTCALQGIIDAIEYTRTYWQNARSVAIHAKAYRWQVRPGNRQEEINQQRQKEDSSWMHPVTSIWTTSAADEMQAQLDAEWQEVWRFEDEAHQAIHQAKEITLKLFVNGSWLSKGDNLYRSAPNLRTTAETVLQELQAFEIATNERRAKELIFNPEFFSWPSHLITAVSQLCDCRRCRPSGSSSAVDDGKASISRIYKSLHRLRDATIWIGTYTSDDWRRECLPNAGSGNVMASPSDGYSYRVTNKDKVSFESNLWLTFGFLWEKEEGERGKECARPSGIAKLDKRCWMVPTMDGNDWPTRKHLEPMRTLH